MALWDGFPAPAWRTLIEACGAGPATRLLDVGCGQGDFLRYARSRGLLIAGVEPDPPTAEQARRASGGDVRVAEVGELPWPDGSFDLVTSFNALQFADDTDAGLAEMARVTREGGLVALVNWAEPALNDLEAIERALSDKSGAEEAEGDAVRAEGDAVGAEGEALESAGEVTEPKGDAVSVEGAATQAADLRYPGALECLLADGGLEVVAAGVITLPLEAPDDATLVDGILGEDAEDHALAAVVRTAARAFRGEGGGYRLVNHFRYAVGRRLAGPPAPPR